MRSTDDRLRIWKRGAWCHVELMGLVGGIFVLVAGTACEKKEAKFQKARSGVDNTVDFGGGSEGEAPSVKSAGATDKSGRATDDHAAPPPPEQAGQLTAGRWRDLQNWDVWLELFEPSEQEQEDDWSDKWQSFAETWGMELRHRIPVHVRTDGQPVADAHVTLLGPDDEILWRSRTDNGGRTTLFPGLSTEASQEELTVKVISGETTQTVQGIELNGDPVRLNLEQTRQPAPAMDIMLTVDTTGSMGDELRYLETELSNVVDRVRERIGRDFTLRLGTTFYRDTQDEYVVRSNAFTENIDSVVGQLAGETAAGGGDKPEAVGRAMIESIKQSWSERARARLLLLVLDAPPHVSAESIERVQQATRWAAERGIRIVPIVGSGIGKRTEYLMRSMAIATHGRYVFLTDDSGIGGDHIEPTIGDYDVHKLNDLLVELIANYARDVSDE